MRATFLTIVILSATLGLRAQDGPRAHNHYGDFMLGIGSGQTNLCTSYQISWKFGQNQRLRLGAGMRFNAFFASDKYFVTAPAKLVKGEAGLGALFKKPIEENMDSVQFSSAQVYSLNFLLHAGYTISDKFFAGFNIDVVGVSFGKTQTGTYLNGNAPGGPTSATVTGAPTGLNLLLVGENDIGSLNSEFFVTYTLNSNWSLKAGIQHVFMEYTTTTQVQQLPEPNDRFRITPTVFCAGVVYRIY
ncbi:MAG: hypothetical protein JNN04_09570 [Cyclobacteriaceae bacterium]|nr:hypothetical protein [Cyclobacteriaceae bacterium]